MLGPVLRGERIRLEPTQLDHLEHTRLWLGDREVTRYLGSITSLPSKEQAAEWYRHDAQSENIVRWSIVANGKLIGSTALRRIDWINRHATSVLMIGDRSQWGKGYATEAVRLRAAYAFRELGLERLEVNTFAENQPMQRALQRSHYRQIATMRRYYYVRGHFHDVFVFELLREEWQAQQP